MADNCRTVNDNDKMGTIELITHGRSLVYTKDHFFNDLYHKYLCVETIMDKDKLTNLDDVLVKFNLFGRYHRELFLFFVFAYLTNSFYSSQYIFAAEEVGYRCKDANGTCSTINSIKCTEWIYDNADSFVAEFGIACQEWKRTLVGTMHSTGYMFGLLLVGPLSDKLGRKNVIILTGVLGGIIGLAKSFSAWYWLYIALEFLESAVGDICSPVYVLNVEIVETKKRVPFYILCSIGYSLGNIILPLAAWGVPYWRNFLRVIYAPALLFFFYKYLIDESPRWLLIKGHKEKAVNVLKKAAVKNKIDLDKDILQNLHCEEDKRIEFLELLKITFTSKTMLKRCLVCIVWWTTCTFVHYGLVINSVSLQGNKYINFAMMSLIDIPVLFIIMYVMMNYKRKIPLIITFIIGAVLCLVQPFTPNNLPWLSIIIYMAGKNMSSFYFSITYMYTSELFPTYTRNSMHALCSSLGRIGSILAPQTPLLIAYWSGLPSVIFGASALLAGFVTFFVPETADDSLPDTICQAEKLGKAHKTKLAMDYIIPIDIKNNNKINT